MMIPGQSVSNSHINTSVTLLPHSYWQPYSGVGSPTYFRFYYRGQTDRP